MLSRKLVVIAALIAFAGRSPLQPGDPFPELSQFKLEGRLPADLAGKVVLVDFWASWCNPCKASFPAMEQLLQRHAKDGFVIVAVNLDDKRADMEDFLKKNPVHFVVVRDAEKKLVSQLAIASMPTSFLLDRAGKISAVHNGFHGEETMKKYEQELTQLLAAK